MFKGIILNFGFELNPGRSKQTVAQRTSGAHRIAHELRDQGWDIEVIDYCNHLSNDQLKRLLISRLDNVKFVGLSKQTTMWRSANERICRFIKIVSPETVIISGSNKYRNYKSRYIDYYVTGYAEIGITKLLKYLFSNGETPIIEQFHNNKVIRCNTHYPATPCKSPLIIHEDRDFIDQHETLSLETSRGCKFKCKFCSYPFLGVKGDYTRDVDNFKYQIANANDRFGVNKFVITDETFNESPDKLIKFADAVEELDREFWFTSFVRADLLISRPSDREHLLRMGLAGQFYGIETFDHDAAKRIGKGMHPDKIKSGLLETQQFFSNHWGEYFNSTASFIIGLPFETRESIINTHKWLEENWKTSYVFYTLNVDTPDEGNESLSLFTQDPAKYGFERIPNEELPRRDTIWREMIPWRHKTMDVFESRKILNYIQRNRKNNNEYNFLSFGPRQSYPVENIIETYYNKKLNYTY